jgi:uncharacterized membrane protein
MKPHIPAFYYKLKATFWFVPTVMAAAAACAALISVAIDRNLGDAWARDLAFAWPGGADGARSVLTMIAASTLTVASIVFTITIIALAQTSSHFGPGVLRNFTSDRGNQFVLGAFVATFLYSLLVLRTVRAEGGDIFVPYVSINLGIALAVLSLAVLIYFIHHIATSIQADLLIARIGRECLDAVQTMFPQTIGTGTPRDEPAASSDAVQPEPPDQEVAAEATGSVQAVDDAALMDAAERANGPITLLARPGDFVSPGQPLAGVAAPGRLDEELRRRLRAAFHIDVRRAPEHDLVYAMQQLAEIASRALSPGISEPVTALLCIDWLGAALRSVAGRVIPSGQRTDDSGRVRVIATPLSFQEIVYGSIGMIRRNANGSPDIYCALLRTVKNIAPALKRDGDRTVLLNEVRQIGLDAISVYNEYDRSRVMALVGQARSALNRAPLLSERVAVTH